MSEVSAGGFLYLLFQCIVSAYRSDLHRESYVLVKTYCVCVHTNTKTLQIYLVLCFSFNKLQRQLFSLTQDIVNDDGICRK